jgi:hypothetical protein
VFLGGASAAESNVIAFSEVDGVRVAVNANKVAIRRNSIRDNGALGIDLVGFSTSGIGVTPNDAFDEDTGANAVQNYPVLTSANLAKVTGMLASTPNSTFELQFFANASADPTGFGEGASFVGSTSVTTDASGAALFTANFALPVSAGSAISATAIDSLGNTSEFSRCVTVTTPGLRPIRR